MADQFNILDRSLSAGFPMLPITQRLNDRFYPASAGNAATSAALGNGTLRVYPFVLPTGLRISHVGIEITVAGEAGSTVRFGIYRDNGQTYPGDLLIEAAATADGTSATTQELACAVTLAGQTIYWLGGAVQNAPTTQPTIRTLGQAPVNGLVTTSAPGASGSLLGYSHGSVAAALPATFAAYGGNTAGAMPRLHLRLAA